MIEQLQGLGLSMGSRFAAFTAEVEGEDGEMVSVTTQRYVSWTTDEAKANAAQELGATLRTYKSPVDPRCSGWEVNASVVVDA